MMATVMVLGMESSSCSTEARKPWESKEQRPQRGQLTTRIPCLRRPRVRNSSTPAWTSVSIGPVMEMRNVPPIPSERSLPRTQVERVTELTTLPASVTPRCKG